MGFWDNLFSGMNFNGREASDNPDDIFSYKANTRRIQEKTGRLGYVKKKKVLGVTVGGKVIDQISGKVDRHSELMQKKGEVWGSMAKAEVETAVASFQEFGLRDMKEGYAVDKMKERNALRADAIDITDSISAPHSSVQNVAQAKNNLDARVQGFLSAKRKLTAANEGGMTGAKMEFNDTGYELLNPEMDQFYAEFDADVARAQQDYAELYGHNSFDDVISGFGMFSEITHQVNSQGRTAEQEAAYQDMYPDGMVNPLTGQIDEYDADVYDQTRTERPTGDVGQQDIMNMIMSDMTGISYGDLTWMSTAEMGYDKFRSGSNWTMEEGNNLAQNVGEESIEAMREAFSKIFFSSAASADAAAKMEDRFRVESARKAKESTLLGQRRMKDMGDESTAAAMTDINSGIRSAEQEYEDTKSNLLQSGLRGKRKVKDVSFKATRPE